MSSELIELGQQALASVSSNVATGAPLIKCKLLASPFYEALRHELQKAPGDDAAKRKALIAAADHCHQIAIASMSPDTMLGDLKLALELLTAETPSPQPSSSPPARIRPVLRVIDGGLSRN